LVLGNEIKGLPPAILKRADKILEIPMKGRKESLNVAVAFGIISFFLNSVCYNIKVIKGR
jgi:tRNA G18 (ribose-2'-O)-methylase SpoU